MGKSTYPSEGWCSKTPGFSERRTFFLDLGLTGAVITRSKGEQCSGMEEGAVDMRAAAVCGSPTFCGRRTPWTQDFRLGGHPPANTFPRGRTEIILTAVRLREWYKVKRRPTADYCGALVNLRNGHAKPPHGSEGCDSIRIFRYGTQNPKHESPKNGSWSRLGSLLF